MKLDKKNDVNGENMLEIYTLGQFIVKYDGELISVGSPRSRRLWELFKYFITYRGKSMSPDTIMETLWPDSEYNDPKRALRTQVCRLRQIIDDNNDASDNNGFITFSMGTYSWSTKQKYHLDAEEFEQLVQRARTFADNKPSEAIELYSRAFVLYKGDYLSDSACSEWLIPIRSYYRSIYLQCTQELLLLLKRAGKHAEAINICEKFFLIEPLEEEIHIRFMEILLATGKDQQALKHYEYISSALYREFGVKPSPAMRHTYNQIKNKETGKELDLTELQKKLTKKTSTNGAFLCDPEVFRFLYDLERRRTERTSQVVYLGLITVASQELNPLPHTVLKEVIEELVRVLSQSLRRGDILSRWNEEQLLLLLPGLTLEESKRVLARAKETFLSQYNNPDVVLHSKFQQLLPS